MLTLLVCAGAMVFFARLRSGAAALFLFGTAMTSLSPMVLPYLDLRQNALGYIAKHRVSKDTVIPKESGYRDLSGNSVMRHEWYRRPSRK